ncbi:MAG: glycogen debranching enzyme family protein [Myxococcaceae bacterium]|nr:glycogen debranching enzyme family protein [Myxococcaceae bacterium]
MKTLPQLEWRPPATGAEDAALHDEWLVTNGLGGYASGTVGLCNTRKYHGLFVPSLADFGRTVMLARMDDAVVVGDRSIDLSGSEHPGGELQLPALRYLRSFKLNGLVPEWRLEVAGVELLKRIVFVHNESTVYVVYTHVSGLAVKLKLRPYPCFRPHDLAPHDDLVRHAVHLEEHGVAIALHERAPQLKLKLVSACAQPFTALTERSQKLLYRIEVERGLPATEVLTSPGYFECEVKPGETVAFCASLHNWGALERRPEEVVQWELERETKLIERAQKTCVDAVSTRLALSADQFIIAPKHRPTDAAWANATGQDLRSLIAGYHWFTDWGRDTMISFEGLTLCTGRTREAAAILRTFQHHVRDGLVPNYFPEGEQQGVYHTADATLWYFHAVEQYLKHTGDLALLRDLWPTLVDVITKHLEGTRFGIGVDPRDGLLKQGQGGYQLTWMDAKVDDWVVTPRRGKAVELSALWFNALKLMETWAPTTGADAAFFAQHAERTRTSFNARFWNEAAGCLFDVVDGEGGGDDASIRPNQVFSISLSHPVLDKARWPAVLSVVRRELLTPFGLRTLSPRAPDFKATYFGDLRSRDAAYHQGTVWPWLMGHYVDALLKSSNDTGEARQTLAGLVEHLQHAGLGSISEIFDATAPYAPRGCASQAWSVAETLRVWLKVAALEGVG